MKSFAAVFVAAALATSVALYAVSSHKTSPLEGRWAVDTSRLPMTPEARPKSVTLAFDAVGADRWATTVEIVDGSGARTHAEGVAPLDGTPVNVNGNLETNVSAVKMPSPNVLIMQLANQGVPASTRIYTVSGDGRTMTETAAYFAPDGKPLLRTNYFTRMQ